MPAYFVKHTQTGKGIVVSNKPLTKKVIKLKNGKERTANVQTSGLQFGFIAFAEGNAQELGYSAGELVPVTLTAEKVVDRDGNELDLFWCNPD